MAKPKVKARNDTLFLVCAFKFTTKLYICENIIRGEVLGAGGGGSSVRYIDTPMRQREPQCVRQWCVRRRFWLGGWQSLSLNIRLVLSIECKKHRNRNTDEDAIRKHVHVHGGRCSLGPPARSALTGLPYVHPIQQRTPPQIPRVIIIIGTITVAW